MQRQQFRWNGDDFQSNHHQQQVNALPSEAFNQAAPFVIRE
ncbi:MAG: hypothetical protein ACI9FZ_000648 [Bacteroidia bacterium]|jgi:hypothetical protein